MSETTKQFPQDEPQSAILKAIEDLSSKMDKLENKIDKLEKNSEIQFEAIREGLVHNSAFDRLKAKFHNTRSDILRLRADLKELPEEVRKQRTKDTLVLEK